VTLEQVERVYSHAQALAQAEEYLRSRPWALLTTYNTAGAGAMIRERGERDAAAVLSPRAAVIHGLTPLTGPIEGVQGNRTRFWIVQRAGRTSLRANSSPARTTLLVGLRNEPGTLLAALSVIAKAGVNISKLESRPNRVGEWEYIFWLDLDGAADSPEILGVMQGLAGVTLERRILGSYPRGEAL
jgi:prephenate dehydratase